MINSLSPTFKATGKPETQEDFIYIQKNPGAYESLLKSIEQGGQENTQAMNEKGDTIALIDKVLGSNTDPLTGALRLQGIPGQRTDVANTKAAIQQIRAQLELAAAGKLKGQGTITENERAILSNAVLSLQEDARGTFRVGDEELRRQLTQAKQILERSGAVSTQDMGGTIRVREIASGRTGTIPVNEFDPNQHERI